MKNVVKALKKSKRVAVIAHTSPDPDCMGSMTALSSILTRIGKYVEIFDDTKTLSDVLLSFNLPENISRELNPDQFDTIVVVDCNSYNKLGKYSTVVKDFKNVVLIDHHYCGDLKANAFYIDDKRSSCCELIYLLAKNIGLKLTKDEASKIFAGIIGDTNCFQNGNADAKTYLIVSKLCEIGIDTNKVIYEIFKHTTNKDIAVKKLVYENMISDGVVGHFYFTRKMQKELETDDLGNMVNDILNNEDNKYAFVVKQKEKNVYTVSLRCKPGFNVAQIASKYGGGGHILASGMMFVGSPQKHIKQLIEDCHNQFSALGKN